MRAVLVVLLLVACGRESDQQLGDAVTGAGEPEVTTTAGEGRAPCEGERHLMLLAVDGVLTPRGELETWHAVEGYEMRTLPGATELATSYHELGLEIVYIVRVAGDIDLHGVPYAQAVERWLGRNGFPTGDRVKLLLEAGPQRVLQEMVSATVTGGSIHGAYVSNSELVNALLSGGAPEDRIYIVGEATGAVDARRISETDLRNRASQVTAEVKPICKVS